jgi:hypothetical protein
MEEEVMTDGDARTYVRVTAEMQAAVLAARTHLGATASYNEIAEAVDLPYRTVRYILTDVPVLRRAMVSEAKAGKSLKARIVEVLQVVSEVQDVKELRRILGMADPDHDIVHVLHSLHSQGKVDFREGKDKDEPTRIHLTKHHKTTSFTDVFTDKPVEPSGMAMEPPPVDLTPEPEPGFPLLDTLMTNEANRVVIDGKSTAYLTAAEALRGVDDEAAADLIRKAEPLVVPFPSPVEAEYLRFAKMYFDQTKGDTDVQPE